MRLCERLLLESSAQDGWRGDLPAFPWLLPRLRIGTFSMAWPPGSLAGVCRFERAAAASDP